MTLATATLYALAVGAWLTACCSVIALLYGHKPTFAAFWRGTILATLAVLLLAELVTLGSAV